MTGRAGMSLVCGKNRSRRRMTEYQEASCSRGWTQRLGTNVGRRLSAEPAAGVRRISADDDDQADQHLVANSYKCRLPKPTAYYLRYDSAILLSVDSIIGVPSFTVSYEEIVLAERTSFCIVLSSLSNFAKMGVPRKISKSAGN